jgi:hypothetical protein
MIPQQTQRMPVPTLQELNEAICSERKVAACSGLRHGPLCALSIGLRCGDTATVSLNEHVALCLVDALRVLFPNIGLPAFGRAIIHEAGDNVEVQCGHMPD